ncbi:unnamed protein product [Linum tenue]|uniref:RRM domain-containing protein n=1 Tax=Linum tenue TaxID=586396 RepID=A0AAV0GUZ2_9ROSI|nr:unnamed protein product [Linum tenue]
MMIRSGLLKPRTSFSPGVYYPFLAQSHLGALRKPRTLFLGFKHLQTSAAVPDGGTVYSTSGSFSFVCLSKEERKISNQSQRRKKGEVEMETIMEVDEEDHSNVPGEVVTGDLNGKDDASNHNIQNPKALSAEEKDDGSGGDSSSESDDDEDDSQLAEQLKQLESELEANPSNYDAHVQCIKLLRRMGELEKLRQAREAMNALFPLTPSMWQEWAKDEASLSSGAAGTLSDSLPRFAVVALIKLARPESVAAIEKLYERGVFDYLSVSLWCDYLSYIQESDPSVRECSPDGISKARNVFERALTASGLHIAEGNKIWEAYREFEEAIIYTIDDKDSKIHQNLTEFPEFAMVVFLFCSCSAVGTIYGFFMAKESQVQRVRILFHRQLSVPLVNLESTLLDYKAWEVEQGSTLNAESSDLDGVPTHVVSAYRKAMEIYKARVGLEEQIFKKGISEEEKLQHFMNYLTFEKSFGDPARVQVLFERAVAEFPVSSDLWLDYVRYMDRTLKVGNVVRDVYTRASKNCPWVGELWVRYLLALERGRAPEEDISAVFERALQCTFSTLEEYLDLFLTRVDGLRRRILFGSGEDGVLGFSLIRKTFQAMVLLSLQYASDYLSPQLKNTDSLLRLHAYWARLEVYLGKDLVAARGVWESLLKTCGSMLEAWQGYITMETELGHIGEARSIYKRCYGKRLAGTGSEKWSVDAVPCSYLPKPRIIQDICHSWLRFEREFGTLEDFDLAVQKVTPRLEELQLYKMQQELQSSAATIGQKENPVPKNVREKRKGGSNITDEQSPAKRKKMATQTQKKEQDNAQHQDPDQAHGDKTKELKNVSGKTDHEAGRTVTDSSSGKAKASSEDLRKFFADVGGISSIRILHDKFTGKSRGLAYVDFLDDEHLAKAIAKNKQTLLGKRLSIARSNPKKGKKGDRGAPKGARDTDGGKKDGESEPTRSRTSDDSRTSQVSRPEGSHKPAEDVMLKGKNTFAVPRNMVKPLGWTDRQPKPPAEDGDEQPKSNDEFRKMFIKS